MANSSDEVELFFTSVELYALCALWKYKNHLRTRHFAKGFIKYLERNRKKRCSTSKSKSFQHSDKPP